MMQILKDMKIFTEEVWGLPFILYLYDKETYKAVGSFGFITCLDLWVILMPLTVWLVSLLISNCCLRCCGCPSKNKVHSLKNDEVGSGDRHDEENPGPNRDGLGQKARSKNPASGMK